MSKPVSFLCTISQTADAIKIHGQDGARLVLEAPEVEVGNLAPAIGLRNKVLRCTLEEMGQ